MNDKLFMGALGGTAMSAVGTGMQTNEILQTVSLVITILGGIVSLIVIPILNWYNKSKKDGKIDSSELEEATKILKDGIEAIKKEDKHEQDK